MTDVIIRMRVETEKVNRFGLPRGTPAAMLYLTETEKTEENEEKTQETPTTKSNNTNPQPDHTPNAATTVGEKGHNGRKGYGQCWECGERGHPRREREVFFKRMGKVPCHERAVSALEATGKHRKGGE